MNRKALVQATLAASGLIKPECPVVIVDIPKSKSHGTVHKQQKK